MPAISLLRSEHIGITYEMRTYRSRDEALATLELIYGMSSAHGPTRIHLFVDICRHYILWMAYAMLVSFQNGSTSTFNFGAAIGMHAAEFMPRVRTCFPMGGFAPLAAYMVDKEHVNKMDFGALAKRSMPYSRIHDINLALLRLLNPEYEHVLIGSHKGQSYITTWPVPAIKVPLLEAAPVAESARDVLSRGIRRRQLKSVQELLAELML